MYKNCFLILKRPVLIFGMMNRNVKGAYKLHSMPTIIVDFICFKIFDQYPKSSYHHDFYFILDQIYLLWKFSNFSLVVIFLINLKNTYLNLIIDKFTSLLKLADNFWRRNIMNYQTHNRRMSIQVNFSESIMKNLKSTKTSSIFRTLSMLL